MDGVADFGDFGEHDGGAGADEEVGCVAYGGVGGDAGEGVAAAALQADDEIGGGAGGALAAVELLEAVLGHAHDGGDDVAEAVVLLRPGSARCRARR